MSNLTGNTAFTMLVLLMGLSGYLQSFAWPNLLPLVHTVCSPDKDTTLLGFWATCPNFGNLIGFIVCQLIVLNNGYSWQVGMYIVACYMAVNALYMCFRI
jgi:sugar phosphate permease